MNNIYKNIFKYIKYLKQIHKNVIFALKIIFHISEKGGTNMKKMWKQMAMALIGIGTVLSVSACGGKENTTSNEPQTTANVAESEAKTEIKVALWDYTNAKYYKNLIEEFEKNNEDISVKVIEISADEYNDKIQIMLSGGDDVDVVFTKEVASLAGLIQKGQVLSLDDYIQKANIDESYYGGMLNELALDGKVYAMPFKKDCTILYYNKDLFDKAGVEYPKDGMTLTDYRELAAKMTSGEGAEKVYGAHLHTWPRSLQNFARKTDDFQIAEKPVANLADYYDIFLKMQNEDKSIMDYGTLKAGNIHYSGVFYNQQCAMVTMGTWFVNNLLEQKANGTIDFNWGICSLPDIDGSGNANGVIGVTPVSINTASKHPEEAWRFIEFATGAQGAAVIANSGIIPAYVDDNVKSIISGLDGIPENFSDYINADKFYLEQPLHPDAGELEQINSEEHSLIMCGEVSIEEGLQEMQKRIDEVLK